MGNILVIAMEKSIKYFALNQKQNLKGILAFLFRTYVLETSTWTVRLQIDNGKTSALHFSPNSTYFSTWQVLTGSVNQQQQVQLPSTPNLNVYDLRTNDINAKPFIEFIEKKQQKWYTK